MGEIFTPGAFEESGGGPLYLQLHRLIAEAIASGRLRPGDSLPSERELASGPAGGAQGRAQGGRVDRLP